MELREYVGNKILYFRKLNNLTQQDLAEKLGTTKQTISKYEKGKRKAHQDILFQLCDIFGISINEFFPATDNNTKTETNSISSTLQSIVNTSKKLKKPRQENVLKYAKNQLNEQNNEKVIAINSLKEDNTTYHSTKKFPVQVTEALAAGVGHSYDENNEQYTVYTDRDNLKNYNLASFISGDSMEPKYKNGDVALIQKGYDNIQGAVYAVDYNGKTFMKKLYNDGHQFRLVSINDKYDDILIDVPVDEDIYFNIVGRVVDSFTPVGD